MKKIISTGLLLTVLSFSNLYAEDKSMMDQAQKQASHMMDKGKEVVKETAENMKKDLGEAFTKIKVMLGGKETMMDCHKGSKGMLIMKHDKTLYMMEGDKVYECTEKDGEYTKGKEVTDKVMIDAMKKCHSEMPK